MKCFYLISNPYRDEGFRYRDRVAAYLREKGAECLIHEKDAAKPPQTVDCVVVLGGDGTLLRTVRRYTDLGLSFVGINTGHLGYLTAGDMDQMEDVLDCLLTDRCIKEDRMMIYARIMRGDRSVARHRALNEIVIGRKECLKIVNLKVYLNGSYLTEYAADGLIVATPTGSTAYSFSAGGPIVEPTAQLFLLTPVSSHSMNNRSLVLSPQSQLSVEIEEKGDSIPGRNEYVVYFDGEKPVQLLPGDRVEIAQAGTSVSLIKLSERSFVETMRSKMSV